MNLHYNNQTQTGCYCSYTHLPKRSVATDPMERIHRMAAAGAVVIFSMSTCCMCHAVKRLFCGMGVSPTVHEIDLEPWGIQLEAALKALVGGGASAVPVVFIGGKLVGPMDRVLAAHISGSLVPLLKDAGALWL